MKKNESFHWSKLDNVGTLYASITTTYNPNIYRLSVKLKEKVNKEILEQALNATLQAIPSFNVKLRKGFFWYYLERNDAKPFVKEDTHFAFRALNNFHNNYFLFSVTYYEKRINVDFSHILTDGTGALNFLITLVTNYMKIKHPKKVKQSIIVGPELVTTTEMEIDSFSKYSNLDIDKKKIIKENSHKAYLISGPKVQRENANVIIGTLSVKQIKEIAKAKDVTITNYLTAALIYSIYHGNFKYTKSKDPITVCIPVNLRNYFPSYSMNNFFTTIMISIDPVQNDYTFDDVLCIVCEKLKDELDKSVLLEKFRSFSNLQHNIILRFIPLVIKDILLRGVSSILAGRGATTTLSNLGIIKVDKDVSSFIEKFDLITYTDELMPVKIGLCSFEDNLSVSFSTTLLNTEIERSFFTFLSNQGVDIKISTSFSNDEGGNVK